MMAMTHAIKHIGVWHEDTPVPGEACWRARPPATPTAPSERRTKSYRRLPQQLSRTCHKHETATTTTTDAMHWTTHYVFLHEPATGTGGTVAMSPWPSALSFENVTCIQSRVRYAQACWKENTRWDHHNLNQRESQAKRRVSLCLPQQQNNRSSGRTHLQIKHETDATIGKNVLNELTCSFLHIKPRDLLLLLNNSHSRPCLATSIYSR